MNILIGADFVPTPENEEIFIKGDLEALLGNELLSLINGADYKVFNLELPFTESDNAIPKCGPNLKAKPEAIETYKRLGIDLFTLANNHILDYGKEGLYSTINILEKNNIAYAGVGSSLNDMRHSHIALCDNKKIGFYMCCEHEFTIAAEVEPGANPFDTLESFDHVEELKRDCDYLIVLYHGGKEHYRYPSPNLQRYCRKFIKKGADLVICQHSHCIGCKEEYNGGTIIYGQGNFLFDCSEIECWQTGMLVQIKDSFEISYIPVMKRKNKVRIADEKEAEAVMKAFYERSSEIQKKGMVQKLYDELAVNSVNMYFTSISGLSSNILFKIINKLLAHKLTRPVLRSIYKNNVLLTIRNYIECEAHHELLLNAIKNFNGEHR